MSRLSDIAPDELVVQLEGRIYYNPMAKTYEIADRFIAGNVIEKAEWIANYLTEHPDDEASRRSLDALKEHTPTPLTFDELDINLGVRWLDTSIYADFARELFGLEKKPQVIYIEKLDEFDITTNERNAAISEEYCVKARTASTTDCHCSFTPCTIRCRISPNASVTMRTTNPSA